MGELTNAPSHKKKVTNEGTKDVEEWREKEQEQKQKRQETEC